jgi:CheY-like chemotaxis protein
LFKETSLKILIAEDYKELAESYKMALEERGHLVMNTRDGVECLRVYADYNKQNEDKHGNSYFDLIILDQNMPGMDGIDVAKEIQRLNPKQRILFITGHGLDVVKKLKQLSETVEIMNKPFTLQALIAQIEGWALYMWREKAKQGFKDWDGHSGTSVPVGPSRSS